MNNNNPIKKLFAAISTAYHVSPAEIHLELGIIRFPGTQMLVITHELLGTAYVFYLSDAGKSEDAGGIFVSSRAPVDKGNNLWEHGMKLGDFMLTSNVTEEKLDFSYFEVPDGDVCKIPLDQFIEKGGTPALHPTLYPLFLSCIVEARRS